jgi:hypothetical protein
MSVLTFVSSRIPPERREEVIRPFAEAVRDGLPPTIRQTFLVVGDDTVAIASVWHQREDLDALLASGEEPFARRVLREAGGDPEARFFEIRVEGG